MAGSMAPLSAQTSFIVMLTTLNHVPLFGALVAVSTVPCPFALGE